MMQIAVLGAGGWGTALAVTLAMREIEVCLWVRSSETYKNIILKRSNEYYLPGVKLPERVRPTLNMEDAVKGKKAIILAVPSMGIRSLAVALKEFITPRAAIVCAAKGLEDNTHLRMSQVLEQEFSPDLHSRIAVISGPNHAEEVARNIPTATVVASNFRETALEVQKILTTPYFRVYTNEDLAGVELGGALKNIYALGAGIAEGLALGDNTKAALVTRGLVEMTRLGNALGASSRTFTGLAGLGDLYVTCSSKHSRNRSVGVELGRGKILGEVLGTMKTVAEGISTTRAACFLARREGVEMPIAGEVYRVLYEGRTPRKAVESLMSRETKGETIAF